MSEDNQSLLSDVLDFLNSLNSDPNFRSGPERDRLTPLIELCNKRLTLEQTLTPPPEESKTTTLLTDIIAFLETLRDDPNVHYFVLNRDKMSLAKRCCEAQR
jgi:hypothetical protein